ncbi:aminoacyl-histidine dipeptidase [Millionella massiliensis]|uniref:aminoacyl-histidine dipeptidase n=1 Tax=Millionella massiliensis TaxID=1871023 RepID=UPI0023A7D6ED|nr:aminoacyl-histidine dipeptidase [Millionella massiliensis]
MKQLTELEPQIVWRIFEQITHVPRPSKKESKIRAFIEQFARDNGLECRSDAKGNIVIVRPAAPGREGEPALILQSHMDMVCEKNADVVIDFENDPIQAYVDEGWVKARGTTLGADCGIGMALQMAVLVDPELHCPRIEALFTVDEEQGLTGAMNLGEGMLTGNRMINLDSEDEGEIFIGCAGGIDTIATLNYTPEPLQDKERYRSYHIKVSGLHGGHSGDDIEKGFANSNKLLTRVLWNLDKACGMRLVKFDGGNLRNAIPREAEAIVALPDGQVAAAEAMFRKLADEVKDEFKHTETSISMTFEASDADIDSVLPSDAQRRLLDVLYAAPHGVMAMSFAIPGLVETSTNLASVKMPEAGKIVITTSQRSSVESAKRDIADRVAAHFALAGAEVIHSDGYPGWAPNPDSPLVRRSAQIYKEMFGNEPKVKAIHAGLECGLFLLRYPHLDMISTGPTLRGVHSPAERVDIASVAKVWAYLKRLVEEA